MRDHPAAATSRGVARRRPRTRARRSTAPRRQTRPLPERRATTAAGRRHGEPPNVGRIATQRARQGLVTKTPPPSSRRVPQGIRIPAGTRAAPVLACTRMLRLFPDCNFDCIAFPAVQPGRTTNDRARPHVKRICCIKVAFARSTRSGNCSPRRRRAGGGAADSAEHPRCLRGSISPGGRGSSVRSQARAKVRRP